MAHDDVRLPLADQARDRLAVLERRHQLAVVDVHDVGLDPEDPRALGHFGLPPLGQRTAGALEVTDVAVGHRHELHLVALRGPQRRHAARLELGVVGMRPECDDPERFRGCLRVRARGVERQQTDRDNDHTENTRHGSWPRSSGPSVPIAPGNGSRLESSSLQGADLT